MDESIDWNNYTFKIQSDDFEDNVIHIRVIDLSVGHEYPVFYLTLKGLWDRQGEGFNEGDYYQDVMNKETMFPVNRRISYAALTHEFLISNATHFEFIKNIYSSSLNGHHLEAWTPSLSSRNFWSKQLNKNIGVVLVGDRYKLPLNE